MIFFSIVQNKPHNTAMPPPAHLFFFFSLFAYHSGSSTFFFDGRAPRQMYRAQFEFVSKDVRVYAARKTGRIVWRKNAGRRGASNTKKKKKSLAQ
jgi:hypothetical protein